MYINVYSRFIYNIPTGNTSGGEWLYKLWCVYTMEYNLAITRNNLYLQQLGRFSRKLCWVKKADLKGYIWYASIYLTFWNDKIIELDNQQVSGLGLGIVRDCREEKWVWLWEASFWRWNSSVPWLWWWLWETTCDEIVWNLIQTHTCIHTNK